MPHPESPAPNAESRVRIGIDLGGTKIEGIAVCGNLECARVRVGTPQGDYAATLEAVAGVVDELERNAGTLATVGIGIPGALSRGTGLVKNANSTWLIGRPLQLDLERRLGRAVRVENDANCFAISEARDGAAAGAATVFGVILGTGVGAGVVVNGRALVGPNAIAGEWGHNPLPWAGGEERDGATCYCGRRGCLELFLSGPGMTRDHKARTGRTLSSRDIVAGAEAGDANAEKTVACYEGRLARGLASVINVLDPDVIVLGGGLSNIQRLYRTVPELWSSYAFGAAGTSSREPLRTKLVSARHGDSSGVRGAAWLWSDSL